MSSEILCIVDDKTLTELQQYAELDGSEWGETVFALLNMYQYRTLLSNELIKALKIELEFWLEDVKESTEIVEEVITPAPYSVKTLEWL